MIKRAMALLVLGWVGWLNVTANDGGETWSISSATETAAQCYEGTRAAVQDLVSAGPLDPDQARSYQRLRDAGHVFTRLSPYSFEGTSPRGTTTRFSYFCLPDNVDPRGPTKK